MKRLSKTIALLIALCLCAAVLAGCKDNTVPDTGKQPDTGTESNITPEINDGSKTDNNTEGSSETENTIPPSADPGTEQNTVDDSNQKQYSYSGSPLYNDKYDTRSLTQFFTMFPDAFPTIDSSTARKPITGAIYDYFITSAGNTATEPLCSKTHGAWLNLADGVADIVFLVAPTQSEEDYFFRKTTVYDMKTYGYDGLAFMVSPECPVKNLTQEQIRGIYEGTINNWNEVGGPDHEMHPYFRNEESGSQRLFVSFLWPDGDQPDFNSMLDHYYFAGGMETITECINWDPYAIGYNIVSYLEYEFESGYVDMVSIDGIFPTTENFSSGAYPYITESVVAVNAWLPEESPAKRLYNWIGSEESIEIIGRESSLCVSVGRSYNYDYSDGDINGLPIVRSEKKASKNKELNVLVGELDKRCLRCNELAFLPIDDLNILRNGVYALSGKKFKTEAYDKYFRNFSWYTPKYDSDEDVAASFNEYQKYNIEKILAYSKLCKGECDKIGVVGGEYIGVWTKKVECSDPNAFNISYSDGFTHYNPLKAGTFTLKETIDDVKVDEVWVIRPIYSQYFPVE